MLLKYIEESVYDSLIHSIDSHIDWYNSPTGTYDMLGLDDNSFGQSSVEMPAFSLSIPSAGASNDEKNLNDLVNIKIVYDAWKSLTPSQARNRYMWAYYCHCNPEYKKYILLRWMEHNFNPGQAKNVFFVTGDRRNLVRGNALSSLWWKGHLTYDPDASSNPFWIADRLATTTNLADLLDTFNSYDIKRTRAVVRAIAEVLDAYGLDKLINKPFRKLNSRLNRISAVRPLDFFDEQEIVELAKREFMDVCLESVR